MVVRWGLPAAVPDEAPPGEIRSEYEQGGGRYWITNDHDCHWIRCGHRCDFRISHRDGTIDVHPDPGLDRDNVPELLLRNALPLQLRLIDCTVLHASAVHMDGLTVAILGPPAAGKSSLAALFCAAGATFVTDDVLRVEVDEEEDAVFCFVGPGAIRLREPGAALATLFPTAPATATIDGRIAVSPPQADPPRLRLDALLLPSLLGDDAHILVRRLLPAEALVALGRASAHRSAPSRATLKRRFHEHASLAHRVPVFAADVPLTALADTGLPAAMLERMKLQMPEPIRESRGVY